MAYSLTSSELPQAQQQAVEDFEQSLDRLLRSFDENEAAKVFLLSLESSLTQRPERVKAPTLALARGAFERERLKKEEGGSMSAEQTRKLLGLSKEAVLKRYKNKTLLGWRETRQRAVRFPKWQFSPDSEDRLLPGLSAVLAILKQDASLDDWGRILFFLNKRESLKGKRALDLLRDGDVQGIAALAQTACE
ncbi:MAG: hypothetical protein ACFCU3_07965 [Verrucomicrobiales bacterium]